MNYLRRTTEFPTELDPQDLTVLALGILRMNPV